MSEPRSVLCHAERVSAQTYLDCRWVSQSGLAQSTTTSNNSFRSQSAESTCTPDSTTRCLPHGGEERLTNSKNARKASPCSLPPFALHLKRRCGVYSALTLNCQGPTQQSHTHAPKQQQCTGRREREIWNRHSTRHAAPLLLQRNMRSKF